MSEHVTIFEMGPRDGLQNEKAMIAPSDKIRLVDMLTACGFHKIEVTSFVSPKWVPQMADAAEVLAGISRAPGVSYAALTPTFVGWKQHRQRPFTPFYRRKPTIRIRPPTCRAALRRNVGR
jgi:hydroxymethylglutaryl-CoA lyase